MNFSVESVVRANELLHSDPSAEVRREADEYLNSFLMSPEAWTLCSKLITEINKIEVKLVGAFVLYRKILQDYCALSPDEREEIRRFVGGLMLQVRSTEHGVLSSYVGRCYAAIGILKLAHEESSEIFEEVFSQLEKETDEANVILLLGLVTAAAEEKSNILMERSKATFVESFLKEQVERVAGYWTKLLLLPSVSKSVVDQVFEGIGAWVAQHIGFLSQPELIRCLLLICQKPEYFEQVSSILVRLLENHTTSWSFKKTPLDTLMAAYLEQKAMIAEAKDKGEQAIRLLDRSARTHVSLEMILEFFLLTVGPSIELSLQKKRDELTSSFTEVLVQLVKSYPVYLFMIGSEATRQIYRFAIRLLSHKDLSVSNHSLFIWLDLHRIVSYNAQTLDKKLVEFLHECYTELFKQLLLRCMISNERDLKQVTLSAAHTYKSASLDEDEDEIAGGNSDSKLVRTTLVEFRLKAQDIFSSVYDFYSIYRRSQGETQSLAFVKDYVSIVSSFLADYDKGVQEEKQLQFNFTVRFEVCLRAYKVLEMLYDEQPGRIQELEPVFETCLSFKDTSKVPHPFIFKAVTQFFSDFSCEFKFNPGLGLRVLEFCLQLIKEVPELQVTGSELLKDTGNYIRGSFDLHTFQTLFQIISGLLEQTTQQSVMENLVSVLFKLASNFTSEKDIFETRALCFNLVAQRLSIFIKTQSSSSAIQELQLFCTLKVLSGCFSNLSTSLDSVLLSEQLKSYLEASYPVLLQIVESSICMPNVANQFIAILNKIADICPLSLYNYAESSISLVFLIFEKEPYKHSELLLALEVICSKNQDHAALKAYFVANLDGLLGKFRVLFEDGKWEHTDFFLHFILFYTSLHKLCDPELFQSEQFLLASEMIARIYDKMNNYEIRRDILKLWNIQVNKPAFARLRKAADLVCLYIEAAIRGLANCSSSSLLGIIADFHASIVLGKNTSLLEFSGVTDILVSKSIASGLRSIQAASLTEEQIQTFTTSLVKAKNLRSIRSDMFYFNLFLKGEETSEIFSQMQSRFQLQLSC